MLYLLLVCRLKPYEVMSPSFCNVFYLQRYLLFDVNYVELLLTHEWFKCWFYRLKNEEWSSAVKQLPSVSEVLDSVTSVADSLGVIFDSLTVDVQWKLGVLGKWDKSADDGFSWEREDLNRNPKLSLCRQWITEMSASVREMLTVRSIERPRFDS